MRYKSNTKSVTTVNKFEPMSKIMSVKLNKMKVEPSVVFHPTGIVRASNHPWLTKKYKNIKKNKKNKKTK